MRIIPLLASILLLAGCNPPQEQATSEAGTEPDAAADAAPGEEQGAEVTETQDAPDESAPADDEMALSNTAWRVTGEDGAIYTTFFDGDGQYRDMKNGEPWQDGTWEQLADGRLCFTPSDENRAGSCWSLGKRKKDGTMRVTSDEGREVMVTQVTYIAPVDEAKG